MNASVGSPPMRRLLRPLVLAVVGHAVLGFAFALGAAGCGAGLTGDTFHGNGFAFHIGALPEGWQRIEVTQAALAFRDARDGGTIELNGRCGVDGEDVPLAALTQHLFLHFTERQILEQTVVPFDRREAMRTVLTAKLDGVPMQFDVWVLKKDGCVYDFAYMASPPRFTRGSAEFERFVLGFSTVSVHAD
jgi:hypothetical protein